MLGFVGGQVKQKLTIYHFEVDEGKLTAKAHF